MNEKERQELDRALSAGSLEKASLGALLKYERAIRAVSGQEVSPELRDQVRLRIAQKVTVMAVVMLVAVSMIGGIFILLQRFFRGT